MRWESIYSRPVDRSTGLVCDQTIRLTGTTSALDCPSHLRRVAFRDPETGTKLDFLTDDFTLGALTVAELYRMRWQVELFFGSAREPPVCPSTSSAWVMTGLDRVQPPEDHPREDDQKHWPEEGKGEPQHEGLSAPEEERPGPGYGQQHENEEPGHRQANHPDGHGG
jgi:hypothetical protein